MGNPSVAKLDSSYCKHIANSGVVTSDDCATSIDCRGTARVFSCRHRNDLQLSGSSCVMTTSSECTRKFQERQQACSMRKSGILPDSKFCHLYYDCSDPAKSKICRYPKLFSTKTNTCQDFKNVKCGSRIEFKSYCQYHSHPGAGNVGPPCELHHPNCEGYPDGANPHTEKTGAGSPWYMLCKGERFIKDGICPNARYGFNKKTCQVVECNRKINKYYPTQWCRGYIWCYYGRQFRYNCPVGTVFEYKWQSCQNVYDVCKPCGTKSC
ncbi:unnamed protein product [Mytilus coruscus]|uniref:Chitin-binding type-2 domain-containing protein n=1 Tax=Mytilus coruscus TaxID=42192 RepID=A0A6J8ABQ4_MYTCO|nr:unnamed protein product [Mytilus coruscus]